MTDYSGKIVDIGEYRFRSREKKRPWDRQDTRCDHRHLTLDDQGHIVRCEKCGEVVSAYWALDMLVHDLKRLQDNAERAKASAKEAESIHLHLIAAKKVEKVWRTKEMVPACPHCDRGILPEDNLGSCRINRRLEIARRKADPGNWPGRPIPEK